MQILFAFMLLFPKINIVSIENSTAGLRIDDIFIAVILFTLLIKKSILIFSYEKLPFSKYYLLFSLIGLISFVINYLIREVNLTTLLFALRMFEYYPFLILPILFKKSTFNNLINWIIILNCIFFLLQIFGLNNGFSDTWAVSDNNRCMGLYGGPYEAGTAINLITALIIVDNQKWRKLLLLPLVVMTVLTQSRISVFCEMLLLIVLILRDFRFWGRATLISLIVILGYFVIMYTQGMRVEDKGSIFDLEYLSRSVNSIIVNKDQITLFDQNVNHDSGVDVSWEVRSTNWITVIKLLLLNPYAFIIGFSPGAFGVALDGGWIRIAVEYGIIGLTAFLVFLYKIVKSSEVGFIITIAFITNMVFADSFISYKVMSIFLSLASYGFIYGKRNYK